MFMRQDVGDGTTTSGWFAALLRKIWLQHNADAYALATDGVLNLR